jgi:hypothetical protein
MSHTGPMEQAPPVQLPTSGDLESAYTLSKELEERFPEQDAYNFCQALLLVSLPSSTPIEGIAELRMLRQGANDEKAWLWWVEFSYKGDTRRNAGYVLMGWSDYTGWDCRAGAELTKVTW